MQIQTVSPWANFPSAITAFLCGLIIYRWCLWDMLHTVWVCKWQGTEELVTWLRFWRCAACFLQLFISLWQIRHVPLLTIIYQTDLLFKKSQKWPLFCRSIFEERYWSVLISVCRELNALLKKTHANKENKKNKIKYKTNSWIWQCMCSIWETANTQKTT